MTKTKRITAVAVSVVLAGTLAVSLAACGKKDKNSNDYASGVVNMALADGATLDVAIGYNSEDTGLFYGSKVGTGKTFAGNYSANAYGAKPATQGIMNATGITLVDHYGAKGTSSNLTELVNGNDWGTNVDLATSDLSVASNQASNNVILNLGDYLDYMPNFKAFLEENPIVYLSVMGNGMNEDGTGTKLYVAPYFDGMDDIEKGVLMRQDWVEAVLDDTWGTTYSGAQDGTFWTCCYSTLTQSSMEEAAIEASGTHVSSYMGTSGSWTIVSTAEPESEEEVNADSTVTIKKNYDISTWDCKKSKAVGAAFDAIATDDGTTWEEYEEEENASGNIVDIMNAAIAGDSTGKTGATGKNLATLYKAYIAAAYTASENGISYSQYYGTDAVEYSKVFNGYSACWDVDDLVALLRIIKCSSGQVGLGSGQATTGIYPRTYDNQRTPDMVSLVGELYGVRGATSRYETTWIDREGTLQDARADNDFWEALEAFGTLEKEGLVDSGYATNGTYKPTPDGYTNTMHGTTSVKGIGFMQWDYSQTQTTHEFDDDSINYGWVNTPVSIWNDGTTSSSTAEQPTSYSYSYATSGANGAGATGKYMRFTDSWRSVKTAGLVVAKSVENNPAKLAAALTFVDYLYSNDGQITTTYALQDTTNNSETPNGTWYGKKVTGVEDTTEILDETSQWIIKNEYKNNYTICNGMVCDHNGDPATDGEGNDISEQLSTYAYEKTDYSVAEEYQDQYFAYDGELYTGTLYKGRMTPTITDDLFDRFIADANTAKDNSEFSVYGTDIRGSFTNFARYTMGSTLPICVKDQSFENQMTAAIASEDATRVGVSLGNDTINHCQLDVTEWNYFYTCVPTGFPFNNLQEQTLNGSDQSNLRYMTGAEISSNHAFFSIYHHVMYFGYSGTYQQNTTTVNLDDIRDASAMITYLESIGLETRVKIMQEGWTTAKTYWGYIQGTL